MTSQRTYDLVLFGATGFTGQLTAEYLARHIPEGCRWALAGRNPAKLGAVRDRLAQNEPGLSSLPLLHADVTDDDSLAEVARASRLVVTTVGPYQRYGEPLVAACAEAGTDYLDLTGEPEFVDRMYVEHHRRATETGARIIHCCGFESIPYDLGVRFTVLQLPEGVPLRIRGMVRAGGTPSSGTFHTVVDAAARGRQMKQVSARRKSMEPRPEGRRVRLRFRPPHRDKDFDHWLVPLPLVDPLTVRRSAAALDRYGPDFEYSHYAGVRRLPVALGGVAGAGAIAAAAQLKPLRNLLLSRFPQGEGPDETRREGSWFAVRFIGEGGGQRVTTEVSGGDPGYGETAKMLGEAALCLLYDDNPETSGQVTPAVALGEHLTDRLIRAGICFEVLEKHMP